MRDLEAAVVGLLRRAALEHDHRGDRLRAAEVGDVKALDRIGGASSPSASCSPSSASTRLAAALGAQALLVERQTRVAFGQLEDPALLAALGRAQLDRPVAPAGERVGERRDAPSSSRCTTSSAGIDAPPP